MCSARRIMNNMLKLKKNVMAKENVDYSSKVLIVDRLAFIILILIKHINNYLKLSGVF